MVICKPPCGSKYASLSTGYILTIDYHFIVIGKFLIQSMIDGINQYYFFTVIRRWLRCIFGKNGVIYIFQTVLRIRICLRFGPFSMI